MGVVAGVAGEVDDGIDDVHTFDHLTEDRVLAVKAGDAVHADEELAAS